MRNLPVLVSLSRRLYCALTVPRDVVKIKAVSLGESATNRMVSSHTTQPLHGQVPSYSAITDSDTPLVLHGMIISNSFGLMTKDVDNGLIKEHNKIAETLCLLSISELEDLNNISKYTMQSTPRKSTYLFLSVAKFFENTTKLALLETVLLAG